jgi:DNA-binding MarR family transcriptional regulator
MGNVVQVNESLELANRLRPLLLKLSRELRREAHQLGVSSGQVTLLNQMHKTPGVGVRELAVREGVSAAAMSRAVDRLERAGLVRRTPDAVDRRRHGLTLTEEAEGVLRSVKRRRTAWLARRLESLPPDEREAVAAALEPLARLLEEPS